MHIQYMVIDHHMQNVDMSYDMPTLDHVIILLLLSIIH